MIHTEVEAMRQALVIRNYAPKTIRTYCSVLYTFLTDLNMPLEEISIQRIQDWQYRLVHEGISWTRFNQMVCSVRFYLTKVRMLDLDIRHIPFQRREQKLPRVISREDLRKLLVSSSIRPRDHAIVSLLYSTGLRLGELVHLQLGDIDSNNRLIHVRRGKGAKARQVQLAGQVLEILRNYWRACKVKPRTWLFPGMTADRPLDTSTIQRLLGRLSTRSGLAYPVTPHMFRHSFATHLLEDKADLRTIQALMGHSHIQTTGRYLQVATHHIQSVVNPLDRLLTP